jgi:hypothetical protein
MSMTLLIEVTGRERSGISTKSGSSKPWCMFEAYVHLPNDPYPQKTSFYAQAVNEVPQPGTYECDVNVDVRDGRLEFTCDPRQGRRKNIPPLSAAMSSKTGVA